MTCPDYFVDCAFRHYPNNDSRGVMQDVCSTSVLSSLGSADLFAYTMILLFFCLIGCMHDATSKVRSVLEQTAMQFTTRSMQTLSLLDGRPTHYIPWILNRLHVDVYMYDGRGAFSLSIDASCVLQTVEHRYIRLIVVLYYHICQVRRSFQFSGSYLGALH